MVSEQNLRRAIGGVRDPHLPFGLDELGMLESISVSASGEIGVVVNVPCHHCPGLQMLNDDIHEAVRRAGGGSHVSVSFQGRHAWAPVHISPEVRVAMRAMGIQTAGPAFPQPGAAS